MSTNKELRSRKEILERQEVLEVLARSLVGVICMDIGRGSSSDVLVLRDRKLKNEKGVEKEPLYFRSPVKSTKKKLKISTPQKIKRRRSTKKNKKKFSGVSLHSIIVRQLGALQFFLAT